MTQPQARVYLFRGALGPIFSRGMDRLTKRLEEAGIRADVYEFTICRLIADQAIRDFREDAAPIVLIGHSMGGLCALTFAGILKSENIPVSLVVTIDPAHASPKVPLNVERFINVFLSDSVLGGGDVVAEQGYQGHYASFDMKQDVRKSPTSTSTRWISIHEQLVTAIAQLATTPLPAKGEAMPLRYVVPSDAPLVLWDSGTPQLARSGDTLQKLAALNQVPLWSLTQANQYSDSAPLSVGQRILISAPSRAACRDTSGGGAAAEKVVLRRCSVRWAAGREPASERDGSKVRMRLRRVQPSGNLLPCEPSARGRR